jgi:hypothetical protein
MQPTPCGVVRHTSHRTHVATHSIDHGIDELQRGGLIDLLKLSLARALALLGSPDL